MSDTREQILEQIKLQGDLVRQLKASKESKEKVSAKSMQTKAFSVCTQPYIHTCTKIGCNAIVSAYVHMYVHMYVLYVPCVIVACYAFLTPHLYVTNPVAPFTRMYTCNLSYAFHQSHAIMFVRT